MNVNKCPSKFECVLNVRYNQSGSNFTQWLHYVLTTVVSLNFLGPIAVMIIEQHQGTLEVSFSN